MFSSRHFSFFSLSLPLSNPLYLSIPWPSISLSLCASSVTCPFRLFPFFFPVSQSLCPSVSLANLFRLVLSAPASPPLLITLASLLSSPVSAMALTISSPCPVPSAPVPCLLSPGRSYVTRSARSSSAICLRCTTSTATCVRRCSGACSATRHILASSSLSAPRR